MSTVTICLVIFLAIVGLATLAVGWLRKLPGLRRRREDPAYEGPPRRNTDCSVEIAQVLEDATVPVKAEIKVPDDVTMTPSKPRASRKKATK